MAIPHRDGPRYTSNYYGHHIDPLSLYLTKKHYPAYEPPHHYLLLIYRYLLLEKGNTAASFYVIGWGFFSITVFLWALGNTGIIEKTYWVSFGPLYGNIVEMVFTAIGLSYYINDLKEGQFQAQIAKAESKNLRTLVQLVCHDIANPLAIIIGSHSILSSNKDEKVKAKYLAKIGKASVIIEGIIGQVKRLEALKSGKHKLTLEKVDVLSSFKEVEFTLGDRAIQKSVKLIITCEDSMWVKAEATSLVHEVLNNFVTNAIKFSDKGASVFIKGYSQDNEKILEVKDQGIGMPPELLKNVFSENKQTSRRGTDKESGTGFGMPLAKKFLEMYGAKVEIESKEKSADSKDHGTTIRAVFKD